MLPLQFREGLAVFQCWRSSEILNLNNLLNIKIRKKVVWTFRFLITWIIIGYNNGTHFPSNLYMIFLWSFLFMVTITIYIQSWITLSLYQSSFSNLSVISPTSQLIFQRFRRFIYITAHYPTLLLLHLRHSSFSNPSFTSPM